MAGCRTTQPARDNVVYVSIAPLKYIVEQIADTSIKVRVLVPETTSPETYEPTVRQIKELSDAVAYIATGLIDFEKPLKESVMAISPSVEYLDLSQGIKVLEGTCSHVHTADHSGHRHDHLVDPHIWLSPMLVKGMAEKITILLSEINPALETFYTARLDEFTTEIDSLDKAIRHSFESAKHRFFAIAHPSLTYYARDYSLEQIPIEADGKEPSVEKMKRIVDLLKEKKIKTILYQRQTNGASAVTIAREIGGNVVEFDPLAEEWFENMNYLTGVLSGSMQ